MARFDVRGMAPHRGAVADLRAARCGGAVVVAAAGCAGGVALVRLGLGAMPSNADAADLEPPQMDLDSEGFLSPSAQLPGNAGVASVDVHGATGQLLAAGGEGALLVQPVGGASKDGVPAYRTGVRGWGGFTQARWVDSHTFATVSFFYLVGVGVARRSLSLRARSRSPALSPPNPFKPQQNNRRASPAACPSGTRVLQEAPGPSDTPAAPPPP
jgi:hypothetical protein